MAKSATTIEQQLDLLKSRGLSIFDIEKAKEILLDIGYYRLGFICSHLRNHIRPS